MLVLWPGRGLRCAQSGCGPAGGSQTKITNRPADASSQWSEDLFSFALENLNHLEDNDCEEMLRSTQQRLAALQQPKIAPGKLPPDALLASWPEPDMLRQVVSRLNQWVDTQEKPAESKPDPMLATLPADLRQAADGREPGTGPLHGLRRLHAHGSGLAPRRLAFEMGRRRHGRRTAGGPQPVRLDHPQYPDRLRRSRAACRKCRGKPCSWGMARPGSGHGRTSCCLRQRGIDAALLALPEEGSSPASTPGKSPATRREGAAEAVVCRRPDRRQGEEALSLRSQVGPADSRAAAASPRTSRAGWTSSPPRSTRSWRIPSCSTGLPWGPTRRIGPARPT